MIPNTPKAIVLTVLFLVIAWIMSTVNMPPDNVVEPTTPPTSHIIDKGNS